MGASYQGISGNILWNHREVDVLGVSVLKKCFRGENWKQFAHDMI